MKQFLIIFREPDGRKDAHDPDDVQAHRAKVSAWMQNKKEQNTLPGGHALTLNGNVIKDGDIISGPYTKGDDEIIGGYLLIQAEDLAMATNIITACPVLDFGGFAEVRECM